MEEELPELHDHRPSWKVWFIVIFFAILAASIALPGQIVKEKIIPAEKPGPADPHELGFTPILKDIHSRHDHKRQYVIVSEQTFADLWSETHEGVPPPLPDVDFSKEMVLGVYLGNQIGDGYTIEITRVYQHEEHVQVGVMERLPTIGCEVSDEIFQPFHLVRAPRGRGQVKFDTVQESFVC